MAKTPLDSSVDYNDVQAKIQLALDSLGYGNRFEVTKTITRSKSVYGNSANQVYVNFRIKDKITGKSYDNIQSANQAIQAVSKDIRNTRSRQVNIDKNAKPVSVKKGSTVSDVKSQYYNSAAGYENSVQAQWNVKVTKARQQVNDYNKRRGKEYIRLEVNNTYRTLSFRVVPTNELFYQFEMAKTVADELVSPKNVKHSAESIADYIRHCITDEDFMSTPISELRSGKF